ncbi:PREDICTED: uncharacterized protein LOC104807680 [Tarenaya hassleriana]|uniref:uncharacterized protein LOC104807680 n=1 Tax=Tarenaya hassleriana TaxID=28532 RepID=UPI00053C229D|nr:PREDICTED: uncharacterized protein LOC104807680 [Tarenaya hassleriana]
MMSLALSPRIAISVSSSFGNHNQSPPSAMSPSRFWALHRYPTLRLDLKLCPCSLRAHESESVASASAPIFDDFRVFDFDSFLSLAELVLIASSTVISVAFAVNCSVLGLKNEILGEMWKRVALCGVAGLVGGVVIGAWIRRRQWKRICGDPMRGESMNLIKRVENLEEELRNSATIIRVLSKHLEKLGNRFRVTKSALKQPIAEIAALAQKNSEATRALAVQEDILEKEIHEIQKVLIAMQEQQQKQLELILTIVKHSKLWESKPNSDKTLVGVEGYNNSPNDVKPPEKQIDQATMDRSMETDAGLVPESAARNPV